ncbi:MAG: hypothetical protein P8129_14170, partial [Anaerolineae bacterium]
YGSLYLDLTREWSGRFKGADFAQASLQAALPKPTATRIPPTPTPTPTPVPVLQIRPADRAISWAVQRPDCGYLVAPRDEAHFWLLFSCPPHPPGEEEHFLLY